MEAENPCIPLSFEGRDPRRRGAWKTQQGDSSPGRNIQESAGPRGGDWGCRSPSGPGRQPARRWKGEHGGLLKGLWGSQGKRGSGRVSKGESTEATVVNWGAHPPAPEPYHERGQGPDQQSHRERPRLPKDCSLSPQGRANVSPGKWHARAARSSVPGRLHPAGYLLLSLSPLAARLGSRGSQLALL